MLVDRSVSKAIGSGSASRAKKKTQAIQKRHRPDAVVPRGATRVLCAIESHWRVYGRAPSCADLERFLHQATPWLIARCRDAGLLAPDCLRVTPAGVRALREPGATRAEACHA
jgi:hypothetical protein